jgi:hypothetical protein
MGTVAGGNGGALFGTEVSKSMETSSPGFKPSLFIFCHF